MSFTCNFFAYFKFHGDWGRVIGKIKQNELDCRYAAPLTEAYIFNWSYFQVLFTVIHSSVLILLRKSKYDGAIRRNMLFMDPVWDSFPFFMRTVQSPTGTKITRVGSATDTKSDWSEFIFRPVPCECMKRNVWRAIWTHTSLTSSWSHAITP